MIVALPYLGSIQTLNQTHLLDGDIFMNDYHAYLRQVEEYLKILEVQNAKFGMMAPPSLIMQMDDCKEAIELTNRAIKGELDEESWKAALKPLIIEVKPIEQVLQFNLQEYFQQPITRLNEDTRVMWQNTIRYAQYGFLARIWMSVAVFLVGLVLFATSSWLMLFGNLNLEQLFGPGISFVAGLGAMIAVIYTGPLKEIRKSVDDLGIASAAFIAYIHRVLEISHTFSYYYLKNQMSFDEMTKSSKLIEDAMSSTINTFKLNSTDINQPNIKNVPNSVPLHQGQLIQ